MTKRKRKKTRQQCWWIAKLEPNRNSELRRQHGAMHFLLAGGVQGTSGYRDDVQGIEEQEERWKDGVP
jgi:hypothetical protein